MIRLLNHISQALSYNQFVSTIQYRQISCTSQLGIFAGTSFLRTEKNVSAEKKQKSPRMKQFQEKLTLESIPKVESQERFVDLMLVKIDSKTGELITNTEKEPTKWGDWQHGGRVSDF